MSSPNLCSTHSLIGRAAWMRLVAVAVGLALLWVAIGWAVALP